MIFSAPPSALVAFRRTPGQRPFIYGHRGARATHPENTLLAFEQALEQGADGVELDVRMAADGGLFVTHDDALLLAPAVRVPTERAPTDLSPLTSSGGRKDGSTISLEDVGASRDGFAGSETRARLRHLSSEQVRRLRTRSGEPVPSLVEALLFQARTGCRMNVELKGDVLHPLWMVRRVSEVLRAHGGHYILLSSFHPGVVWALRRRLPEIPVALLVHAGQPVQRRLWPLGALGACVAHPEAQLLDAALMQRLRRRVQVINTWTVNEPDEALRLSRLGVDGLVTDSPDILRAALQR